MRTSELLLVSVVLLMLIELTPSVHGESQSMIWSTQVPYLGSNGKPHDFKYFMSIKELGFNTIFLTVPWGAVEYGPNEYDFHVLDQYMNYTEALGLRVILVFFYSVPAAAGDPDATPPWLLNNGELEVDSLGQPQNPPALAWWNMTDRQYYFNFIKTVVSRYVNYSNFLGVLVDFGWLDDDWGPGVNGLPPGYAESDVLMFQHWLMQIYHSNITLLNKEWGTIYRNFSQITPTTQPFIGNWKYFQEFRVWSINETYSELFGMIRSIIGPNRMLLFYWGGSIDDIYSLQMPEIYFQLARRYNVTIVLDDADHTAFAVFFSQLAKAYHVHLMMEWTPVPSTRSYYSKYLSHLILGYPWLVGGDYYVFIRSLNWFWPTVQLNAMVTKMYELINGTYPSTKVALLYMTMFGDTYGNWRYLVNETGLIPGSLLNVNNNYAYYPFNMITVNELALGLVNLSNYKYLILMVPENLIPSSVQGIINQWRSRGGVLVSFNSSWLRGGLGGVLSHLEEPVLVANASVEAFPIVNNNSVFLAINNYGNPVNTLHVYVNLTALGLRNGTYVIINLDGGDLLNVTNGGSASFNVNLYYTMGVVMVGIMPVKPIHMIINISSINASYHYETGVFNIKVNGLISPKGNYVVTALVHTNLTQAGSPFTSNGLVYESVSAGEATSNDGYFTINLTLPMYQVMLNSYTLILNIYVMSNGYVVNGESYVLNMNLNFTSTPYGWLPSVSGVNVTGYSPLIIAKPPPVATVTATIPVNLTSTVTTTVTTTTTIVSTETSLLTSTILKSIIPRPVTVTVTVGVIVLILIVAVALVARARLMRGD
ncbi:MAG: beta-galactosidase [Caldivirga sp.]|uniref:beta-galactosidase n=3 Tax=Caldivirga sp. TaxID=2080243 RepID=UPI003D0A6B53